MALAPGTRLGVYEIVGLIGAGGMGEVYRARDTRLDRQVAIKSLPDSLRADPERAARFEREAKLLATLNHPNIATIHGLEEINGEPFIVMELVEGDTLADRVARGPIPLEEALPIAKQVAEALEAAHEQGVVHRDLKPANVKLRTDGTAKVLDFGLAKALNNEGPESTALLTNSPTRTSPIGVTHVGVLLGTAAYMSPEQARGRTADRRSDIWAFGCVLFEMLSGKPAVRGDTIADVFAGIVKEDLRWTDLPATVTPSIRRLIGRCLEKDPRRRLQAIGEARIAIDASSVAEPLAFEGRFASRRVERAAWIGVVVVLATALAALLLQRPQRDLPSVEAPELRIEIFTPPTSNPASFAISPDGQQIVMSGMAENRSGLLIRSLNAKSARPLASTDGALYPFWSPDSRSVGFFADGKLKTLDVASGAVRELAAAPLGMGGSWNRSGVIIFSPNRSGGLVRIDAALGGSVAPVTQLSARQLSHRFPEFLPDGRHFILQVIEPGAFSAAYVSDLDGMEVRRLVEGGRFSRFGVARFASPGYLLFTRGATLFAQPFDLGRLEVQGIARPVAEDIGRIGDPGSSTWHASDSGAIAYRSESGTGQRQLVWFDRNGKETGRMGTPDRSGSRNLSLSPDGKFVAVRRALGNDDSEIWLMDARTGNFIRLTTTGGTHNYPIWSPDGGRVAFSANPERAGFSNLYQMPVNATAQELVLETEQIKQPEDWSSDGRFLIYRTNHPDTVNDIFAVPLEGERKPFPVVQTTFDEQEAQFSPDAKWIAFRSNETGSSEVYVQRFPGPGRKTRISNNGGAQVRWRANDGKELFYVALDGRLMAVPVALPAVGDDVEVGVPVPLFATRIGGALQGINRQQYSVTRDGQRFLMDTLTEDAQSINVILNWKASGPQ